MCGCGCRQWYADAINPENEWIVHAETDYPRKALNEWAKNNEDSAAHARLTVRRVESVADERARAEAEMAELFARWPQARPGYVDEGVADG